MKKVLLDENLPRQLKRLFTASLDVTSVPDLGWQSKKNGELLSAMSENGINILLTADRNLRFQQNLARYGVRIVVLLIHDTRRKTLEPLVTKIEQAILDWDDREEIIEIDLRKA